MSEYSRKKITKQIKKMKSILKTLSIGAVLLSAVSCGNSVENREDARIDELLSKMTLEEKLGQMNQVSPGDIDRLCDEIRGGKIGSILNIVNADDINRIQKVAMEESRLGIPVLVSRDVIHGYKTILPIPLGQAATFNPEIVKAGARMAAVEASADGIRWTFAPMIDISRDPRWGRIAESCGEDPYLTSIMGTAMVEGFQGDSLNDPTSIAACAKHFVAYGAAESGRDYNSTFVPERLLRNVYLPPFKAAADAGCATFMTSFNDNNGVPSTANQLVLKQILRNEWQYDGMVVSDWASVAEMVVHGFCENNKDAAEKAINAGLDMEMVSGTFISNLKQSVEEGKVSMKTIDNAVRNILRLKFRLGLFDNPYVVTPQSVKYCDEHLAIAKKAAEESIILLKNENATLPIRSNVRTVAVVGPLADAPYEQMGTWVFDGEREHTVTPLAAIREMYGKDVQVIYEKGLEYSRDKRTAGIQKAVNAARRADMVIAIVGEESILSGEAHSLANLNLQGAQSELINKLSMCGKPLVTVVMAGRPLTISREVEASDAVLYSFHPGTMGGPALADILFGKISPSAKTPVTFPNAVGQCPIYYAQNNTGRPAFPDEMMIDEIPVEAGQTSVGCRSFFLDEGTAPLFPFGFGLSYTTFEYSKLTVNATEFSTSDVIKVSVELANTGNFKGSEIVQLYVQDKVGSVTRPVKELKRFEKIELNPGEKKTVTFELPVSELAFWNIDMKHTVEKGSFKLWVGTDSQSGLSSEFSVL